MTMKMVLPACAQHVSPVIRRQWLTPDVFVLGLERPPGFDFTAGQRVRLRLGAEARDYSVISGPHRGELEFLIRTVPTGIVSAHLSRCPLHTPLHFNGPGGHFIYRPSSRPAVFAATGTGIAPFAAMCRNGVRGFIMLHGVRTAEELYYRNLLEPAAAHFVPCLTAPGATAVPPNAFAGRTTRYLQTRLAPGDYDFYLAGRREMIADAMAIIDERFPASRVYTEIFF